MKRATVEVLGKAGPPDARYVITRVDGSYTLTCGGVLVARSVDPRRLSDFVFDKHGLSVRWDMDLGPVEEAIRNGEL